MNNDWYEQFKQNGHTDTNNPSQAGGLPDSFASQPPPPQLGFDQLPDAMSTPQSEQPQASDAIPDDPDKTLDMPRRMTLEEQETQHELPTVDAMTRPIPSTPDPKASLTSSQAYPPDAQTFISHNPRDIPPVVDDPDKTVDMPLSTLPSSVGAGQNLLAGTRKIVKEWTGKIAAISNKMGAIAGQVPQPPAPPMELYHAPQGEKITSTSPPPIHTWKRSRTLRVAMHMRQRRERWRRTQPRMVHIWIGILAALVLITLIGSAGGSAYGYSYYQSQLPKLQGLAQQSIPQTTSIYDRNGVLLWSAYDQYRTTPIEYKDVPKIMQDAMTSTEDRTFWNNPGIDFQGILRAGLGYAQTSTVTGGASTITQQVIKNLLEGRDKAAITLNRKVSEATLAVGLTQQYPKWKILEMYFNVAGFGTEDQGVESAAQEYFGLQPKCNLNHQCTPAIAQLELNAAGQRDPILGLARASLLAGMPQNPTAYDPTRGPDNKTRALNRQKDVLNLMVANGVMDDGKPVTPAMAAQAEQLTAQMTFTPFQSTKLAPHFVDWIIDKVETALGHGDINAGIRPFLTGGFNIRTTIDVNLENYIQAAVTRHLTQPELQAFGYGYGPLNTINNVNDAAVLVLNSKTGEILAMDGSSDYNSSDPRIGGEYNVVDPPVNADGTPPGRPPGSSFKPIEYVTSFEKGWYPGMAIPDYKTYFPNGTPAGTPANDPHIYTPPDFSIQGDANYHHNATYSIRTGTGNSFNITALRAMTYAGTDDVLNTAERLGITTLQNNGTAWGIGAENVPLIQMVDAYQTFANQGQRIPPQGILDIWDNYGHNLYHYDPEHPDAIPVLSPQVSYLMTSVLMDDTARRIDFGEDHDLSFYDHDATCGVLEACSLQVAAKTGTTDSYADNLTIGYTPGVVVGVWAGNADDEPMKSVTGISGAGPIWHSVMELASHGWCNQDVDNIPCPAGFNPQNDGVDMENTFPIPPGVHQASVSSANGLQGGGNTDWMIDGQDPLQSGFVPTNNNNNNNNNGNNNGNH